MDKTGLGRLLFLKIVLLYYQCGAKGCQVTVNQEYQVSECRDYHKLSCQFTSTGCADDKLEISWFRYLASRHENLSQNKDRFIPRRESNYVYLEMKNLTAQDSGIYICCITYSDQEPTAQNIGEGTLVMVLDTNYKTCTEGNTALIVLCTLMFIYCVTVFSYYTFKSKGSQCSKVKQNKDVSTNQSQKNYNTRRIFQAIAQEYHRRYDGKTQKQNQVIEDDTIYQNTSYTG
ncbi:immunoglobulin superfamily member 6 isoform X2 [Pyxicephalus adspersus]|uniref:immunoglobulin superfamily member 6 isoform X2 n=1 Tax=Pyxicephalus adspersus TaxID=30357 RepID=UPI003B5B5382